MQCDTKTIRGFTLIEMSIVLVIIGLIIGGILVGRDLIAASEVTAQISQITKYNSAVNAFHNKYGGIPGDLNIPLATQFGFVTTGCSGVQAFRDGNGLLDGQIAPHIYDQTIGEVFVFWADITQSGLTDVQLPSNGAAAITCNYLSSNLSLTSGTLFVGDYFPPAKIGRGNYLYVYETNGANWYGLSAVTSVVSATLYSSATIPVIQAYNIDKKMDDGLRISGTIRATYLNASQTAVQNANAQTTDGASSCYNTTNNIYSLSASANGGSGLNCALSFEFQ